jgi:tetratricopeptide (TPR) repeat protein
MSETTFLLLLVFLRVAPAGPQSKPVPIPQEIQTLLDAHDYAKAEQALKKELERAPGWDLGHVLLGQVCNQLGEYAEAEHAGLNAIRLRESLDGFMVLAVATMHLQKLNESIGWLEKAAYGRPDFAEIYNVLGLDYALGGNLVESEKAFRRAAELEPRNWEFRYLHGRALYELRLYQDSEKALRKAIGLNPQSIRAWTALGLTQELLYDATAAEASYQKALEFCGAQTRECAWPLMQLGFLASRRKSPQEATELFRKSIAARPDWAKPHFYLGKSRAAGGDFLGARAEIETAVRLDAGKPEYHYQLAQVYRKLGESQKAEEQMTLYQSLTDAEGKKTATPDFSNP